MEIYTENTGLLKEKKIIFTLGMFDGVHLGHQFIIKYLNEIADREKGESAIMTFNPHPRNVLQPEVDFKLLTTLEEKTQLLNNFFIKNLFIQKFTQEFSNLTSYEFVKHILVDQLNIDSLVIGYDHHLGKNREGSFEQLKTFSKMFNFKLYQLPPVSEGDVVISSTKIRIKIEEGNLVTANEWLGYNFSLIGKVVEGDKIGRTIGFPTANIQIDPQKICPKNGVYFVKVKIEEEIFNGMMNIGMRPTVNGIKKQIEVHILDFERDIYGKQIEVNFYDRERDEQKFTSIDHLKQQLNRDRENTVKYFKNM